MDINLDRLRYLDQILPANCRTVYSTPLAVREALVTADLVVGAVLIPGAAAPKLVRREDLKLMRKGSVIVDVAVDQGGCIETVHATTHAEPTYVIDGVIHYGVANMPGAVPRTSTFALTNATLSWTVKLAELGPIGAVEKSAPLRSAANLIGGKITYQAVAEAFSLPFTRRSKPCARSAEDGVVAVDRARRRRGRHRVPSISSTGHLILAERALGIGDDDSSRAFAICIQAARSQRCSASTCRGSARCSRDPSAPCSRDSSSRSCPPRSSGSSRRNGSMRTSSASGPVVAAWFVGGRRDPRLRTRAARR
jgi:hypothetical protein